MEGNKRPEMERITTPELAEKFIAEQVEALRLCDLEGFDQDKAAEQMMISRGTLQRILYGARRQMADALVHGKGIRIEGGHYQLHHPGCTCQAACQHCRLPHTSENQENEGSQHE